jgi:hypothetical protein
MFVRWTNRFWSVSLENTLFLDFLKLFVNMRLTVSFMGRKKTHFLDLRIKTYGCLKFQGEVWARRACVGANEEELTTCAKFWRQEVEEGGKGNTKKGDPRRSSRQPLDSQRSPGNQRSLGGRPRPAAVARRPRAAAWID